MAHYVIACPDRHLSYFGWTPDRRGVGGGVTARIRLAEGLAAAGHRVEVVANVPRAHRHEGVRYVPLDQVGSIDCEVLVAGSTGGDLDLTPIADLQPRAALTLVWIGGRTAPLSGLSELHPDVLVAPSNFIRDVLVEEWGTDPAHLLVIPNGVVRRGGGDRDRDPFRLLYTGHPRKGLDTARAVLELLRADDPRFTLRVLGGPGLWGDPDPGLPETEGISYGGLVGQRELWKELRGTGFALHLQEIPEAFGIAAAEAMAAGAIVVASPVGALPELIRHGHNGFLVPGEHESPEVSENSARLISGLSRAPDAMSFVRRHAATGPLEWSTVARAWDGYVELRRSREDPPIAWPCPDCGGTLIALADGYHCLACGRYRRELL